MPNKLVNQQDTDKVSKTLNSKNKNLSFEEFFLLFENFSRLTSVKGYARFSKGSSPAPSVHEEGMFDKTKELTSV